MTNPTNSIILIIEDDQDIADLLEYTFSSVGYTVIKENNGLSGLKAAQKILPDIIILDIMLPCMDGISILKSIRKDNKLIKTGIIMLTAKGEEIDRIIGFELGATDYVVKPFSPRELLLRVKSILERNLENNQLNEILRHKTLTLDTNAHKIEINGQEVNLTATEFKLLTKLLHNKGKVQSREQLLSKVWDYSFDGYARTVDTHVRRLRQKLGEAADYIETLRGVGYRFKE